MKDNREYIDRKALLEDIDKSVVFSTRDNKAAEVMGARKVLSRIMAAPTVDVNKMFSPWFSVNDKEVLDKVLNLHKAAHPQDMDVELIVMIEGAGQPSTLFYDGINFYSEEGNGDICFHKVTHWMPLPAPPEKGDVE